jgi:hypothetical protein
MMMKSTIWITTMLVGVAACGGDDRNHGSAQDANARSAAQSVASATSAAASFKATVSGAVERTLAGEDVPAGSMYGRYHISALSDR